MHATRHLVVAFLAVAAACSNAGAQVPLSGDRLFKDAISAMLNLTGDKGDRVVPITDVIVVDAEAFDFLVAPLGFADDRLKGRKTIVAVRPVQLKPWKNTALCRTRKRPERCTLPSAVTALRFFSPTWLVRGTSISIEAGLYHRLKLGRDGAGIGGSLRKLRLELRNGTWVLVSVVVTVVA